MLHLFSMAFLQSMSDMLKLDGVRRSALTNRRQRDRAQVHVWDVEGFHPAVQSCSELLSSHPSSAACTSSDVCQMFVSSRGNKKGIWPWWAPQLQVHCHQQFPRAHMEEQMGCLGDIQGQSGYGSEQQDRVVFVPVRCRELD